MNEKNRLSPSSDYPAAHSMDTTWFAVDKDGHVGVFESAEGGAVPNEALNDQQGEIDPFEAVRSQSQDCGLVYALDDVRSPRGLQSGHAEPFKRRRRMPPPSLVDRFKTAIGKGSAPPPPANDDEEELVGPVILLPVDPTAVEGALNEQVAVEVKCTQGFAVLFEKMPIELYRSIHANQQCLGCYYDYSVEYGGDGSPPQYSAHGMYYYSCCEDQMAAPYGRHTIPERPLTSDQLPDDLRTELEKVQFGDLSFADTPYIQPASRTECFTWDGGYIDEDWKTFRANPGQEAEFDELYRNLKDEDLGGDLRFERPNES